MPFGLLAPIDFQIIWLSNLMYISMANVTYRVHFNADISTVFHNSKPCS
jgi:hypothetical protein